jgi:hypothetical protein
VAVQIAQTGQMNTRVIRPDSIRHLREKRLFKAANEQTPLAVQPELRLEPGYPLLLGTLFKVTGTDFAAPSNVKFNPERWMIIPLNLTLCFLSGILLFLLGLRLFSPRVALTALTVFFLSGIPLSRAVEGTELCLALFLFTFAVWCLMQVLTAWEESGRSYFAKWVPLFLGSGALALLVLTRYAAVTVIPGVVLLLFLNLKRKAWIPVVTVLFVLAAAMAPWVARNLKVSGRAFGLAGAHALLPSAQQDTAIRSLSPIEAPETGEIFRSVAIQSIRAVQEAFTFENSSMGSGLVFCLFVATFFYAFQRKTVSQLRWMILLSYAVMTVSAGFFGLQVMEAAFVFYPLVALLGTAFFYLLLDRLDIQVRLLSLTVIAVFILFQTLPLLTAMTSPKPYPYPPYNARIIHMFTEPFQSSELFCSDIPEATAWYGGQASLPLPATVNDFFFIHDRIQPVAGLYFTMATRNLPYQAQLLQGGYREWMGIMDRRALPNGFPLSFYMPVMNGEQILYADDRARFYPGSP